MQPYHTNVNDTGVERGSSNANLMHIYGISCYATTTALLHLVPLANTSFECSFIMVQGVAIVVSSLVS